MLRYLMLLTLMLLFCQASFAQQMPEQAQAWQGRLEEAIQLVETLKDSLEHRPKMLQDSTSLQGAIDTLGRQGLDSLSLEQVKDSLWKALANYEGTEARLKEAEERLKQEIKQAKEDMAMGLLPPQAQQALKELEGVESLDAAGVVQGKVVKSAQEMFAAHPEKLREARRQLAKYKGRFDKVESVKDMPKGFLKLNPLKCRPWPERTVIGTLWQFGKQEAFSIDLAPTLAWRVTDLLSVGAGFQYRVSVEVGARPWVSNGDKVLGYSLFLDHRLKSFFGRLHYEHLNAPATRLAADQQGGEKGREWVPGLSLGLGRSFSIYGPLQGYMITQYNVLYNNSTPYLSALQVRLGIQMQVSHFNFIRVKK